MILYVKYMSVSVFVLWLCVCVLPSFWYFPRVRFSSPLMDFLVTEVDYSLCVRPTFCCRTFCDVFDVLRWVFVVCLSYVEDGVVYKSLDLSKRCVYSVRLISNLEGVTPRVATSSIFYLYSGVATFMSLLIFHFAFIIPSVVLNWSRLQLLLNLYRSPICPPSPSCKRPVRFSFCTSDLESTASPIGLHIIFTISIVRSCSALGIN